MAPMLENEGKGEQQILSLMSVLLDEVAQVAETAGWDAFRLLDRLTFQESGQFKRSGDSHP
jgi:hypothetical protein